MNPYAKIALFLALPLSLVACDSATTPDNSTPPENAGAPEAPVEAATPEKVVASEETVPTDPYSEAGNITDLTPMDIGPFHVKAIHIGDVSVGHFNLYIEGGEPAAVRAWVGEEDPTSALVTLAAFEEDHHCAHIEVPQPLADTARLWVELETPDGERLRGSSEL